MAQSLPCKNGCHLGILSEINPKIYRAPPTAIAYNHSWFHEHCLITVHIIDKQTNNGKYITSVAKIIKLNKNNLHLFLLIILERWQLLCWKFQRQNITN